LTSDAATAGLRAEAAIEAVRARPSGIWVGRRRFELAPHHCFACGEGWATAARRRVYETAGRIIDSATDTILATATSTFVAATGAQREALAARYGIATPGSVDR